MGFIGQPAFFFLFFTAQRRPLTGHKAASSFLTCLKPHTHIYIYIIHIHICQTRHSYRFVYKSGATAGALTLVFMRSLQCSRLASVFVFGEAFVPFRADKTLKHLFGSLTQMRKSDTDNLSIRQAAGSEFLKTRDMRSSS